jgi:DNA-binding response OmpR family regulator
MCYRHARLWCTIPAPLLLLIEKAPMTDSVRRILIVEDEMMIAMYLEDLVSDQGHQPVGPAMRLEQAMILARDEALDAALLDVNLGDAKSFPAAEILRERGVPLLFLTGYGASGLPEEWKGSPTLEKPFEPHHLAGALKDLLSA